MDKLSLNTFGQNLQKLRIAKGLSLSQLANDAGVAKSNLSRIEQGSGNPTIDTIWRLAMQLNVPFGSLVASVNAPIGNDGVQVKLIEQGTDNPKVDAYWMSCAPNTNRIAEAHSKGTTEHIMVISGMIETGTQDYLTRLTAGESCSYAADNPHVYKTGDVWTTLLVTITYEKSGVTS
jgi:transcriptional regulator with XRE-family HTH domain